jgi:hypothetical protein
MGMFLVLLLCAVCAYAIPRRNSRFGAFNSRLGANKFPFGQLRELTNNALIFFIVFGDQLALSAKKRKNSRFYGNYREPGFCAKPAQ